MIRRVRPAPAGRDQYGDPQATTAAAVELDGAFVAPRTSSDIVDVGRDGVAVGLTLYWPGCDGDVDLKSTDLIDVAEGTPNDGRYQIIGEVASWTFHLGSGRHAGITAALERAAG